MRPVEETVSCEVAFLPIGEGITAARWTRCLPD